MPAFILKDQYLSGHIKLALQQILLIWSNQIDIKQHQHQQHLSTSSPSSSPFQLYCTLKEKPLVYGRGSPLMDFKPIPVDEQTKKKLFLGSLPTTIFYEKGFCEIYGQSPDIDSTALMISTTSWILSKMVDLKDTSSEPTITLSLYENADKKK